MRRFLLAALLCIPAGKVNDKVCWVACRKDGFDTGAWYGGKKCICGTVRDFDEITDVVIKVSPHPGGDHPTYFGY